MSSSEGEYEKEEEEEDEECDEEEGDDDYEEEEEAGDSGQGAGGGGSEEAKASDGASGQQAQAAKAKKKKPRPLHEKPRRSKKSQHLSILDKVAIINRCARGSSQRQVARDYDISHTAVSKILKNKAGILAQANVLGTAVLKCIPASYLSLRSGWP